MDDRRKQCLVNGRGVEHSKLIYNSKTYNNQSWVSKANSNLTNYFPTKRAPLREAVQHYSALLSYGYTTQWDDIPITTFTTTARSISTFHLSHLIQIFRASPTNNLMISLINHALPLGLLPFISLTTPPHPTPRHLQRENNLHNRRRTWNRPLCRPPLRSSWRFTTHSRPAVRL
jgi:hypothetical protein